MFRANYDAKMNMYVYPMKDKFHFSKQAKKIGAQLILLLHVRILVFSLLKFSTIQGREYIHV
jgi:hypothetical protein